MLVWVMSTQFEAAEREVERESAALRKELRLVDLVGIQIVNIMGLFWVGTAGKLGSSHVMFWLPAVLLFYVPSGIVVAHLVKEMPLEGGLYQWAKLRFNPAMGFLVAMNIWLYSVLVARKTRVVLADNLAYGAGPRRQADASPRSDSAGWARTARHSAPGPCVESRRWRAASPLP